MKSSLPGNDQKLILFSGFLVYLLLLILSLVYYKERIFFSDSAYQLFHLIKESTPAIQANRFGAVFTQMIPLLFVKLKMPLETVAMAYSASFVLFHAAVFFCCFFFSREKIFASVMLLYSIFLTTETFYWAQSELLQGIAFNFLFFCLLCAFDFFKNVFAMAVFLIMLVTIAFFHPLMVIVFLFQALFILIDKRYADKLRVLIAAIIAMVVITVVKNFIMPVPAYDAGEMQLLQNLKSFFPDYLGIKSNGSFLSDLWKKNYLLVPVFAMVTLYYVIHKQYLKWLLCFIFLFGYLALINITHPDGYGYIIESQYALLGVFVLVPFFFEVWPKLIFPLKTGLLFVMIAMRLYTIQQAHQPWTERLALLRGFLIETDTLPQKKILVPSEILPIHYMRIYWGVPYEVWLLSTIESGQTRSVAVTDEQEKFKWLLQKNKSFSTLIENFEYHELPSAYFYFSDTTNYCFYDPQYLKK